MNLKVVLDSEEENGSPGLGPALAAHRDFVRRRLPDQMTTLLDRELCRSCTRQRADGPAVVA